MRWIALLFVLVASTDASARPLCELAPIVPAAGSVPVNAKIWLAGSGPWRFTLDGAVVEPARYSQLHAPIVVLEPTLGAGAHVLRNERGEDLARFVATEQLDGEAPQTPVVASYRVAVDGDTTLLRIERGDDSHVMLIAGGSACEVELAPHGGCVRVTAFDLAGNASLPAEHCGAE